MQSIIETAKEVIRAEAQAVSDLESRINNNFYKAINLILNSKGRIILTGMGKSGIIARKISATMNSTGTPSAFLHPSDAIHGDLGMVTSDDIIICISKSGDTAEIRQLIPRFKQIGVKIIAMVGKLNSTLSKKSDIVLDITVKEEACPLDLAPTSSTTAALAMGDALAMTLVKERGFTKEDFAMYHPGGTLGKQLLLKVDSLMITGKYLPIVDENTDVNKAIEEISEKKLGAVIVVDNNNIVKGIITDGDLRRLLQNSTIISNKTANQIMNKNPKTISKDILAVHALQIMENYKISQLIVINDNKNPIGILHLHHLVEAGLRGDSYT